MAEPWTLRVALAYPASLVVPCAGLVVLAMSWPAQPAAGRGARLRARRPCGRGPVDADRVRPPPLDAHGMEPFQCWHLAHHRHAGVPIRVPVLFSVLLVLAVVACLAALRGQRIRGAPVGGHAARQPAAGGGAPSPARHPPAWQLAGGEAAAARFPSFPRRAPRLRHADGFLGPRLRNAAAARLSAVRQQPQPRGRATRQASTSQPAIIRLPPIGVMAPSQRGAPSAIR